MSDDTPTVPFSSNAGEADLRDALNILKKEIFLSLNCHHLGTIQSFNSAQQTARATINYKKTYFTTTSTGKVTATLVPYPLAMDCPVVFLGGGPTALTFPIAQGDECIILFNDRDIDNWFSGNTSGAVASSRLHSFSDGIILVGVRSLTNKLTDFDSVRALLKDYDGGAQIGVNDSKVMVGNDDTTLNTLLQSLVTDIKNLVTAVAAITVTCAGAGSPSSPPLNVAAITAVSTALTTLGTQIGGLLE